VIELLFTYGSEKEKWVETVTPRFNDAARTIADGRRIHVTAKPGGSGEIVDGLLHETEALKAHVVSPASLAYVVKGNGESNEAGKGDLIVGPVGLVNSPIVVAMWRERAEALGWPKKALGWKDLFQLARDSAAGNGGFRLAHTNPLQSNSGLQTLLALAYAGTGKFEAGLNRSDVSNNPALVEYIRDVEKGAPFYAKSTGFLADKMLEEAGREVSAAVLYESLVIAANRPEAAAGRAPRIVAIYPSEGTFDSEHPVGIVNRPWVTDAHKEAAQAYIAYLRAAPQQAEAKRFGFRPTEPSIDVKDLARAELGVSQVSFKRLKTPPESVIRTLLNLWPDLKNPNASEQN
jgi:Ca-activated chloride channel family protein